MSEIAILLFDGVEALDAVGPYQVFNYWPGAKTQFVALDPGPKSTATATGSPLGLIADKALEEVPRPDLIVVPGGDGTRALMRDPRVLDWLRSAHHSSRWTTSVCTGSLVLGAAGILDGVKATSHWAFVDRLSAFGARPTGERVVQDGKVVTAAGVSAGIDMALTLLQREEGDELAQTIQLGIEYDPEPPVDAGSPKKAPAAMVSRMKAAMDQAEDTKAASA